MQAPFSPSINETKTETEPCEHLELVGEEISFPLISHWLFGHNSIEAGWQWQVAATAHRAYRSHKINPPSPLKERGAGRRAETH